MTDVIIIGGGIIGMLTARELSISGAKVTLFDRHETGRESSWAGGGIISPLYPWRFADSITGLASWGQQQYFQIAEELEENTGVSPEWTRNGLLILDREEQAIAIEWAKRHNCDLEIIDQQRIAELEPALTDPPFQAIWMPNVAQVRNPRLARSLRLDLEKRGVNIREFTPVEAVLSGQGHVRGVRTKNGDILADRVIACAGAWSGGLLEATNITPEIRPIRGQMILFKAQPDLIKRITLFQDRYTIPRRDGRVLMGSTLEDTGFEKQTTEEAREELIAVTYERFPALADFPVEHHWAGLRPSSPSGIPYIGPHPDIEGLYVNSGHFRNGVVLGPASCRLAADIVLARDPILDPTPFALTAQR